MVDSSWLAEVTVSSKNQIVIPREAREALHLEPGDKLIVVVRDNKMVIVEIAQSPEASIRGIARDVYEPGYLGKERKSWD